MGGEDLNNRSSRGISGYQRQTYKSRYVEICVIGFVVYLLRRKTNWRPIIFSQRIDQTQRLSDRKLKEDFLSFFKDGFS